MGSFWKNKLLGELDVLSTPEIKRRVDDPQTADLIKLENVDIQAVSAGNVHTKGAALIDGHWIPKSQLMCDLWDNIYITSWKYKQVYENG